MGPQHSMPDPGTLFKKKPESREIAGLSAAATDEPVVEVRIVGNKLVPTPQVLNEMQTRVGRPYDPVLVQRDVRKLASKSWFVSVEPQIQQTPAGRIVVIKVVERPAIRYVEYLGNKNIRDTKLTKETGLKVGGTIDPYEVEDAHRKIIDLYKSSGFNDVQVTIMEGNKATDTGVVFVIDEGTSQRVWKVEFVGNEFVSGGRLKTQIQSKPPTLMLFSGFVDREKIDQDVERLTAYYRSFGFFQAKIGRKLEFNEKGNWLTLTFVVNEGPRYEVRNVSYMGNKIFAETSLGTGMKMLAGQSFEQAKMNSDTKWIKDLYGSQGYVFADIQAEPIFLEEPGKIDLLYHIEEGKQWRVGRVFVHVDGDNPHTRIQTALNRISLHPGEICDIREIHASERRLQASSLFLNDPVKNISPKITYRIQGTGDEEVARGHDNSFHGQSPDDVGPAAAGQASAPQAPQGPQGPQPNYTTYALPDPPGFVHYRRHDGRRSVPRAPGSRCCSPTGCGRGRRLSAGECGQSSAGSFRAGREWFGGGCNDAAVNDTAQRASRINVTRKWRLPDAGRADAKPVPSRHNSADRCSATGFAVSECLRRRTDGRILGLRNVNRGEPKHSTSWQSGDRVCRDQYGRTIAWRDRSRFDAGWIQRASGSPGAVHRANSATARCRAGWSGDGDSAGPTNGTAAWPVSKLGAATSQSTTLSERFDAALGTDLRHACRSGRRSVRRHQRSSDRPIDGWRGGELGCRFDGPDFARRAELRLDPLSDKLG